MLMKTDRIYHEISPQQDDPTVLSLVSGRSLAHGKRSVAERAFLGADLHSGRVDLVCPTIKQSACLVHVCVPYVAAAIVVGDDQAARDAVIAGELTLPEAAKASNVGSISLAEHFARATPDEWLEAARVIGPGVIWDTMIAPLV
jgi:hypothetical protein